MKTTLSPLLIVGLLLFVLPLLADDEKAPLEVDIAGRWNIAQAATLDGGRYTGSIRISENEDVYTVQWTTEAGNYPGLGLRNGNDLFVGWGDESSGIVVYDFADNGILDGEWAFPGFPGVGTERLTPLRNANQLVGTYRLVGTNPDGAEYTGSLVIEQNGGDDSNVYQLTWGGNAGPATGIGMRVGDRLVVGYGAPAGANGVVHYHFENNAATGRWTIDNADGIANEDLMR